MKQDSILEKHRNIFVLLFVFSCIATYFTFNNNIAFGFAETYHISGGNLTNNDISGLSGAFAPLIGMSSSPFIALTILSGMGTLLNSGVITDSANIPFSEILTQLPISQTGIFVSLLGITLAKFLLSMFGASKVFSDATLGKLENYVGAVCTVGGTFLISSLTTVYAAEIATSNINGGYFDGYLLTNIISFILAVLAYVVYVVMKTMIAAIDILAFLLSPIPGTIAIFNITKHVIIGTYTWYALTNPFVASIIGLVCLTIACLVFRTAKRLELYYRKIYLTPLFNAITRRGSEIPLMPKKLPYGLAKVFSSIEICVEGFFMNKTLSFYRREMCYLVRSEGINYIFKKRILSKAIKITLPSDTYVEKTFRFVKVFTDEDLHINKRKVSIVLRREHSRNIAELIEKMGLIDYSLMH